MAGYENYSPCKNSAKNFSCPAYSIVSKWKVLVLFLTVFTGKHVNLKEADLVDVQQLKIVAESDIAYQVDD
jgi:diacylglycerol kinase family enzyme